jgi:hypothetical protein
MSAWLEEELRSITATDDKHIASSYGLQARPGESLDFRYQDAATAVRRLVRS